MRRTHGKLPTPTPARARAAALLPAGAVATGSKVVEGGGADPRLKDRFTGQVKRLGLTATQRASLVAFLESLTDSTFLTAEKISNPFR